MMVDISGVVFVIVWMPGVRLDDEGVDILLSVWRNAGEMLASGVSSPSQTLLSLSTTRLVAPGLHRNRRGRQRQWLQKSEVNQCV